MPTTVDVRLIDGIDNIIQPMPYPVGGTTGQLLRKNSNTDGDFGWFTLSLAFTDISGVATAAQIPNLDAAKITTGTIDIARLPVVPSQVQVVSSGDLTALTTTQQNQIGQGTIVTTTDGNRYVYSGTGTKTVATSYITLADITPDWTVIANKPTFATVATTGSYNDLTGKPTLGTLSSQNSNAVTITGGTITGITDLTIADGGTGASTAAQALTNLGAAAASNGSHTGTTAIQRADITRFDMVQAPLTIASDAITVTGSNHLLSPEAAAADNLININGGVDGQLLILRPATGAAPITIKSATGNIKLANADYVMFAAKNAILLVYSAADTAWYEIMRTNQTTGINVTTDANDTVNGNYPPDVVYTGARTAARSIILSVNGIEDGAIRSISNMTTGGFNIVVKNLSNAGTTLATLPAGGGARFGFFSGNWVLLPGI